MVDVFLWGGMGGCSYLLKDGLYYPLLIRHLDLGNTGPLAQIGFVVEFQINHTT